MTHPIDLHHAGVHEAIASYLLDLGGGAFALVDPGPGSTLLRLEAGVHAAGFELAGLTHVLVSHVHLDHAGAAGALARRTGATVACHPRAAPPRPPPPARAARCCGSRRVCTRPVSSSPA